MKNGEWSIVILGPSGLHWVSGLLGNQQEVLLPIFVARKAEVDNTPQTKKNHVTLHCYQQQTILLCVFNLYDSLYSILVYHTCIDKPHV
jgi:hypothetical protein